MVMSIPLDWIEEIKEQVFALETAPILPPAHPFPEKELSAEIKKRLGLDVQIEVKGPCIVDTGALKEHLSSTTTRLFSFSFAPFTTPVFAAVGHEDLSKMASWLLAFDMAAAVSLQSAFQESFYLFMGAAALDALTATAPYQNKAFRLLSTAGNFKDVEPSVSFSVVISHQKEALSLLILLPTSLQKEMKTAAQKKDEAYLTDSIVSSKIHLAARLLIDLVPLNYSDIVDMREGSLLLLNKGSETKLDSVQIVIGKRAFFTGQVAGNALKITALAEPLEEIKKMDTPPEKNASAGGPPPLPPRPNTPPSPKAQVPPLPRPLTAPPAASLAKAAPTPEQPPSVTETSQQKPADGKAGAPAVPATKLASGPINPASAPTPPLPVPPSASQTPSQVSQSEEADDPKYFLGEDEEFFVEDAELADVLKKNAPPEKASAQKSESKTSVTPLEQREEEPLNHSVADIPLQVEVVVGYMKLSIKDLLSMHVGGSYTLANSVTAQVDLLINGKRIAKGELVKSGNTLGVRILSL